MTFKPSTTVGEIARQAPLSIRLFDEIGIDYCCRGNKSLAEACRTAGAPLELTLQQLNELNNSLVADPDIPLWQEAALPELIRHIVETHHEYIRNEIPRLESLLEQVNERYGKVHPELTAIKLEFGFIAEETLNHMHKEEQVLFPYIEQLEQASQEGVSPATTPFGSVARPVECMRRDHAKAGEEMQRMRELSNHFTPPENASIAFRELYDGLRSFEQDLHHHLHLENNILFPRAIALEANDGMVA